DLERATSRVDDANEVVALVRERDRISRSVHDAEQAMTRAPGPPIEEGATIDRAALVAVARPAKPEALLAVPVLLAHFEPGVLVAQEPTFTEEEAWAARRVLHPLVEGVIPTRAERALDGLAAAVVALPRDREKPWQLEVDGVGDELAGHDVDRMAG